MRSARTCFVLLSIPLLGAQSYAQPNIVVGAAVSANRSSLGRPPAMTTTSQTPSSTAGSYCLIEDYPDCYYTLGTQYCPAPGIGESFTDLYMSHLERTSQVLTNAARMSPSGFRAKYMSSTSYSCTTATRAPLRYQAGLQQAALQFSVILSNASCPFQHNTCTGYCWLYASNCNWWRRIQTYQPNWQSLAENLAMVLTTSSTDPTAAVLAWIASSGHCANIFASGSTHLGTGATGRYWVQNFAKLPSSISNPIYDGSHLVHATHTAGKLRFLATYYHPTLAPQAFTVVLDGRPYSMALHMGNSSRGTYAVDMTAPSSSTGCLEYYFTVNNTAGNYTLPEVGAYLTNLVGTCTQNWAGPVADAPTSPSAASHHAAMSPGSTAAAVIVPLVLLAVAAAAFAIYYKRRREGGGLCLTVAIPSVNRPSSRRIAKSPTSGQKKTGSATPAKPPRSGDASATTSPRIATPPSTPPRKPPRAQSPATQSGGFGVQDGKVARI